MIKLDALEKAFAAVEELSRHEETFSVGGIPVTVRPISDEEQIQIWKYSSVALEQGDDSAAQHDWMHRVKIATLSYAIVQLGDTDLRSAWVDTGEKNQQGKPIKREKHEVVRTHLSKLPSALLLRIFARYGEFIRKTEIEAEKAVEFDPADYGTEIERLEKRIEDLKEQKEEVEKGQIDPLGEKIKAAVTLNEYSLEKHQRMVEETVGSTRKQEPGPTREPQTEPPVSQPEPAPEPTPEPTPEPAPERTRPPQVVYQASAERPVERSGGFDPSSSFIDPYDEDTIQAIEAQQARLLAIKQRQLQAIQNPDIEEDVRRQEIRRQDLEARRRAMSGVSPVSTNRRKPPHVQAIEAQQAVAEGVQVGVVQKGGKEIPVYQLPPQMLSKRGKDIDVNEKVELNASQGQKNPKFKSPRR